MVRRKISSGIQYLLDHPESISRPSYITLEQIDEMLAGKNLEPEMRVAFKNVLISYGFVKAHPWENPWEKE
jgi:hypothetical protein